MDISSMMGGGGNPWGGAIGGIAKIFGAVADYKAQQKKADALMKAYQDSFNAHKAANDVDQSRRSAKLNAVQGGLNKFKVPGQGGKMPLAAGAPDYSFDPAVLAEMQKARPYEGSLPADPHAGLGWAAIGGASNELGDYLLNGYASGKGSTSNLPTGVDTSGLVGSKFAGPPAYLANDPANGAAPVSGSALGKTTDPWQWDESGND